MPGAREGKGRECCGGDGTLHLVYPGIHYLISDGPDNGQGLMGEFIIHYGLPEKILSDQRRNFESELIADLCKLTGAMKHRTSQYHPQTNGQCERFNSTLINMLGTLPLEHKSDWKGSIRMPVHAYNCTHNSGRSISPYFLMYSRQPQLPIDVTLRISPKPIATSTCSKYIQKLREHIKSTHKKADLSQ